MKDEKGGYCWERGRLARTACEARSAWVFFLPRVFALRSSADGTSAPPAVHIRFEKLLRSVRLL